tara:strand:- start:500 stop:1855 length:1356 start_codon:yes stop_codon:yes gene_type:complete
MGFNWKAFAGSYLDELTEGIDERIQKAEDYKKEQKALADRNLQMVKQRDARAQEAARIGRQAMSLGATKAQVVGAMSSGMTGISKLRDKLQTLHTQQKLLPGQELSQEDIQLGLQIQGIENVDPTLIALDLEELARRTYGAKGKATSKTVTEPGEPVDKFVRDLFGFGAKDRVDEKLGAKKYYGDMTIADINFLAQQGEYNSLLPNVTMNFADLKPYDNEAKYKFSTNLLDVMSTAVDARKDEITAAGSSVTGGSPEKAAKLRRQIQLNAAKNHIRYYAGEYYLTGFFEDEATKKMIAQSLAIPGVPGSGQKELEKLMEEYGIEVPEEEKPTVDEAAGVVSETIEEIKDEEKKTLSPTEKETLSTKARIEENVYYQIEDEDGKTKVVKGVPPRPTRDFSNLFFGAGLGGDTMEEILEGKIPVPKYLRPSQWDELFGETHNPDGSPKQLKGE